MASGDEGIRTPDPLLARQVLSQLSYTPRFLGLSGSLLLGSHPFLFTSSVFNLCLSGLKWTRTTDLTLIRRAL